MSENARGKRFAGCGEVTTALSCILRFRLRDLLESKEGSPKVYSSSIFHTKDIYSILVFEAKFYSIRTRGILLSCRSLLDFPVLFASFFARASDRFLEFIAAKFFRTNFHPAMFADCLRRRMREWQSDLRAPTALC